MAMLTVQGECALRMPLASARARSVVVNISTFSCAGSRSYAAAAVQEQSTTRFRQPHRSEPHLQSQQM